MRRLMCFGAGAVLSLSAWGQGAIAFTHASGAEPWVQDVFTMNADGSNVLALTNDGHSSGPSWSPDGRRILFIHSSASNRPDELYVMDADGSNRRLLRRFQTAIYSAAWSPDGNTIAVSCAIQPRENLAEVGQAPVRSGVHLLRVDGKGELRLLAVNVFSAAWSPDGKRLALTVEQPRGGWSIHIANADGSQDVRLTHIESYNGSPAWSRDGKLIAFDQLGADHRRQQIFVMEPDGSHKRQLTRDQNWSCMHPTWSPDGSRIAFSCRSASSPCDGVSSVGTILPPCTRRIFSLAWNDPNAKPVQISDRDGMFPEFAPAAPRSRPIE
jgi:Tol biopolymer transport system component